jgi:hypothetical protein
MADCRFAFICLSTEDGPGDLFSAEGIGVERISTDLPAARSLTVVFRIDFGPDEVHAVEGTRVEFVGPRGLIEPGPREVIPSLAGQTAATFRVGALFPVMEYGRHWFVVTVAGAELARLPVDFGPILRGVAVDDD